MAYTVRTADCTWLWSTLSFKNMAAADAISLSFLGLDGRVPHTIKVRVETAVAVDGGLVAGRDAERSDPEMDRCVLDTLDQVVLVHGTQHGEGGAAIGQRPVARREHTLPIHARLCVDLGELHLEVLIIATCAPSTAVLFPSWMRSKMTSKEGQK